IRSRNSANTCSTASTGTGAVSAAMTPAGGCCANGERRAPQAVKNNDAATIKIILRDRCTGNAPGIWLTCRARGSVLKVLCFIFFNLCVLHRVRLHNRPDGVNRTDGGGPRPLQGREDD